MILFIQNHFNEIKNGGKLILYRKILKVLRILIRIPQYFVFLPLVMIIRLLSPFITIRFGELETARIGHLAANTELYLCEKDARINTPHKAYIDIFYLGPKPYCNRFLIKKWNKILNIFPRWLIHPIVILNNQIPYGKIHVIGNNEQGDRDVHNLLDKYGPHLKLTPYEEQLGETILNEMGIPHNTKIVCLLVRDSAYLNKIYPNWDWNYHNYRDCNIENYIKAAEYLVDQGFFVLRMGRVVNKRFVSSKDGILDYANSKWASDFMDIYLGAKCTFCISSGSGWDAVPAWLFRKPVVFTNLVPIGYLPTFSRNFILISRKHIDLKTNLELSLSQIFSRGVGFCTMSSEYEAQNIRLVENTPEEICDIVLEMVERLQGTWRPQKIDTFLQENFWEIFPKDSKSIHNNIRLHGEIRANFGAVYLRKNQEWI